MRTICKRGHEVSPGDLTALGKCRKCERSRNRDYYWRNIEARRAANREFARRWRLSHLVQAKESKGRWRESHVEYLRACRKKRALRDKTPCRTCGCLTTGKGPGNRTVLMCIKCANTLRRALRGSGVLLGGRLTRAVQEWAINKWGTVLILADLSELQRKQEQWARHPLRMVQTNNNEKKQQVA